MGCTSSRPEAPAGPKYPPLASSKVHPAENASIKQTQQPSQPAASPTTQKQDLPKESPSSALSTCRPVAVGWQHILEQLRQKGLLGSSPQQIGDGMLLGVSVELLTTLAGIVGDSLTTEEVLTSIVSPAVAKHGCSFASLLSPSATGRPRLFVSHRRGVPFAELADAVSQRVATMQQSTQAYSASSRPSKQVHQGPPGSADNNSTSSSLPGGETLVWVDVLCMPQMQASGQQAWAQVQDALRRTEGTILVMDTHASSLSRLWVVTEVIATVRGDPGSLLPGMGLYLATPSRPSPPANPGRGVRTGGSPGVASHCDIDQGVLAAALTACHFSTGGLTGAGLQCRSQQDTPILLAALTSWDAAPAQCPSHASVGTSTAAATSRIPTSPNSGASTVHASGGGDSNHGSGLVEALAGALRTAALQEAHQVLQMWGQQGPAAAVLPPGPGGGGGERTSRLSAPQATLRDRSSRQSGAALVAAEHLQQPQSQSQPQQQVQGEPNPEAVAALRAANALARCGSVLHALKELDLAEGPLRRALQLRGRVLGGEAAPTAASYIALGTLYLDMGDLEQAEPLLRRGIAHKKRCVGKEHVEVGDAISVLGLLLLTQRNLSEAEAALKHALRLQRAGLGSGHARTATTAANLASVLKDVGKLGEAEELYRGVLEVHTQILGPSHPHVGVTAGHLAYLLQQQGRREEALHFAQQAADIMLVAHGREHPFTAAAMANLGTALQSLGRLREAHTKLQEALDVLIVTQGEGHPDTTTARAHLAQLERVIMSSKGGRDASA